MPVRALALFGAVCLSVGWLLASLTAPPVARLQALPERPAPGATGASGQFVEQLQWRMRQAPGPPTTRRNPFVYAGRERADAPAVPAPAPAAVDAPPPIPVAAGPSYSLAGLAVRTTSDGPVRTAIVSDGTTVHLVKQGETLGRYTVSLVTEDSVTLVDTTGARFVLRLR